MLSGASHFWEWLELLHTLRRVGYDGWLGADVSPKQMSPSEAYSTNFLMIERMTAFLDRVGMDRITELVARDGATAETFTELTKGMG